MLRWKGAGQVLRRGDRAAGYPGPGVGARKERRGQFLSAETWQASRSGESQELGMDGGLLGWREEGSVEGRGLGWKCQWSEFCVSLDGGEHPTVAPLSKSGR